eukprot:NODE_358_length_10198_cov_0.265076.p2 type:complete len:437 gc:universal NODE_358_length_10198_cov_0.265076:139-1449(+)
MDNSSATTGSSNDPKLRPFIRKVIQLNRLGKQSSPITDSDDYDLPEEHLGSPGVDVNMSDPILEAINMDCQITVFDYDAHECEMMQCDNCTLEKAIQNRPPYSKVRWVNVDGISYDVIKILTIKYDLHPLAIEDIIHINQRIKLDKYPDSLFVSMLALSTGDKSPSPKYNRSKDSAERGNFIGLSKRPASMVSNIPLMNRQSMDSVDIRDIIAGNYNDADVQQLSIFLLPNNIIISFITSNSNFFFSDLWNRLHSHNTLVRQSEDASLLVHGILDSIIDHAMPIIKNYGNQISVLESKVFHKPTILQTQALHRLQVELNILKNTLLPFMNILTSLKSDQMISQQTKTYLSDVQDHTNTITENIEFLSVWSKNLIDLSFNMLSYEMNVILKILAVVSCLFLPITFLAGVYGTNFENLPEYKWEYGYVYFWALQFSNS